MNETIVFDLSTEGLDPLKHRIIGITTKTQVEEEIFTDREESKILQEFWNYLKANNFKKIIGFNSQQFDIPFLILRSMKHRIPMHPLNSIDLRKILTIKTGKKDGTLQELASFIGMTFEENGYHKMHMSLLWEAKHLKNLREYLLRDVKITWQLYKHIQEAGLI
ncbi:MAG: ribonuclease H-like domain-containing protein [Nanoarchaeota archaeon]